MSGLPPLPPPDVQAQMRAEDHDDKRRQTEMLVVSGVFTGLAFIVVVLRCISRFVLIKNPKLDDYFILGAIVLTIGYMAQLFYDASHHYIGFPVYMIQLEDMVSILKSTLSIEVIYYAIIFCVKTSILLTYMRFAISRTFRMLCIGTIALHAVFFIICLTATLSQCRPLSEMWDLTGTVEGECINTTALFYSTSGFNIVTDIWILLLPAKTLHSINRPRREKILLYCVFGAGTFACIASIVRLHTIYRYTLATDPFQNALLINLWSMIEVNIAICCASVSALKPIFNRAQRERSREAVSAAGKGSSDHSRARRFHRRFSRRLNSNQNTDLSGITATTNTMDLEAAEAPFPPTRPLAPPVLGAASTLFGNTTTAVATSSAAATVSGSGDTISSPDSSMLFQTPLSPRIKSGAPRPPPNGEKETVNSSGSVLLIEKQ